MGLKNLGSIDCDQKCENPWIVNLPICKTGADATIMSESCFKSLKKILPLKKTLTVLKSPSDKVIKLIVLDIL